MTAIRGSDQRTARIFWQFVGLGYPPDFLRTVDDTGDRVIDQQFFDDVNGKLLTSRLPEARRLSTTLR